jgi:hypothetical protein
VNNAVSRVAALLAIAVFGIVMSAAFDATLARQLDGLQLPPGLVDAVTAQRARLAGLDLPRGASPAAAQAIRHAVGLAFVAGFRSVMLLSAVLALLAALAAWAWIGRTGSPPARG